MNALPIIDFKNKSYVFDKRLKQLRELNGLFFIDLDNNQIELLEYAINSKDKKLIKINMSELIDGN